LQRPGEAGWPMDGHGRARTAPTIKWPRLLRCTPRVRSGSRLCENSARYNRTQNFEACGHAQSKKMQKFVSRSALRPNQISFSHSLGQKETKKHVRCHGSFRRKRPWRLAGPPMTLGNMRANGVRSLDVSCWQCHHRAILSADPWPDHVPVPAFGPRMVCA
jgi:hypothetical protein